MPQHFPTSSAVQDAIQKRLDQLRWSKRKLAREAGIANDTARAIAAGRPGWPEKERAVEDALGWAHDSIRGLREHGTAPTVVNDNPGAPAEPEPTGPTPVPDAPPSPEPGVPTAPSGLGLRVVPRPDGTVVDFWLTELINGAPVTVHYPAAPGTTESSVKAALTQSMEHMRIVLRGL